MTHFGPNLRRIRKAFFICRACFGSRWCYSAKSKLNLRDMLVDLVLCMWFNNWFMPQWVIFLAGYMIKAHAHLQIDMHTGSIKIRSVLPIPLSYITWYRKSHILILPSVIFQSGCINGFAYNVQLSFKARLFSLEVFRMECLIEAHFKHLPSPLFRLHIRLYVG